MVFFMNNLDSCEKLVVFCACFEYTLTVLQMKRAKTLTQGASNWQTSVKITIEPWELAKSWRSAYTTAGETEIFQMYRHLPTLV